MKMEKKRFLNYISKLSTKQTNKYFEKVWIKKTEYEIGPEKKRIKTIPNFLAFSEIQVKVKVQIHVFLNTEFRRRLTIKDIL